MNVYFLLIIYIYVITYDRDELWIVPDFMQQIKILQVSRSRASFLSLWFLCAWCFSDELRLSVPNVESKDTHPPNGGMNQDDAE